MLSLLLLCPDAKQFVFLLRNPNYYAAWNTASVWLTGSFIICINVYLYYPFTFISVWLFLCDRHDSNKGTVIYVRKGMIKWCGLYLIPPYTALMAEGTYAKRYVQMEIAWLKRTTMSRGVLKILIPHSENNLSSLLEPDGWLWSK